MRCPACAAPCAVELLTGYACLFPQCRYFRPLPAGSSLYLTNVVGGEPLQAFVNWTLERCRESWTGGP